MKDKEELNLNLYRKMQSEQAEYREWLITQPPDVILQNAAEYATRADILLFLEYNELNAAQAEVLLKSAAPLADLSRAFSETDTSQISEIQSCIEQYANAAIREEHEATREAPLYPHSWEYALAHEETRQYNDSFQANVACREAIERAISEHHDGYHFDAVSAVDAVLDAFGSERVAYVLANTVQRHDFDGRISRDHVAWAATVPVAEDKIGYSGDRTVRFSVDQVHMGLVNMFVKQARKEMEMLEKDKAKKPSVLKKLQEAKENIPTPTPHKSKERER